MKRVMIVDDEVLVRIGIKSLIPWETYGYTIVADASDGEEALEKIEKYRPQIVLTDLMMEPGNGFWLMKECQKRKIPISFIVLSNYNDFENVKEAMKAGAKDYVFKLTVRPQELLDILEEIDCGQDRISGGHPSDEIVRKNRDAIMRSLFQKLTAQQSKQTKHLEEEVQNILKAVSLNQAYSVLYLRPDNLLIEKKKGNFDDIGLLRFALKNVAEEILTDLCPCEIFPNETCDLAVIMNISEGDETFAWEIKDAYQRLRDYVRQYFGIGISAALSGVCVGVDAFCTAVNQDWQMLRMQFFSRQSELCFFREIAADPYDCADALRRMEEAAEAKDEAVLLDVGREILDEAGSAVWSNPEEIRNMLRYLYRKLNQYGARRRIDTEQFHDRKQVHLEDAIAKADFLADIRLLFLDFMEYLELQSTRKNAGKPCRKEITEAKRYINAHCAQELTLPEMAAMCGMSESRFSHVFKEETGSGFAEYVVWVRIEMAVSLLLETDLKINEIAERVGIYNPNYFSALFKRKKGMSPNEYRRQKWRDDQK